MAAMISVQHMPTFKFERSPIALVRSRVQIRTVPGSIYIVQSMYHLHKYNGRLIWTNTGLTWSVKNGFAFNHTIFYGVYKNKFCTHTQNYTIFNVI